MGYNPDPDRLVYFLLIVFVVAVTAGYVYAVTRNDVRKTECEYWNPDTICVNIGGNNYRPYHEE